MIDAPHIDAPFSTNGNHPVFVSPDTNKNYPIITAEYALLKRPPIEWAVAGLFQPSSLAMIVGNFGIGKTYAALDMAVAVSRGDTWLERDTVPCPVLVIDEESGERRISDRMGMVLRGHEAGPETPIYAVSFAGFNLREAEGVVEMANIIHHIKAKLVIIDALMDVIPGADENKVQEVMPALKILREIAEETGACIVLLHHTNKLGDYRGSTAIAGKVDVLIKMERELKSNTLHFSFTKARDTEATDFAALMNFLDDRFWLSASNASADKTPHFSRSQQYVIEYVDLHPDCSMKDIMDHADSCSENAARQAVYALAKTKLIMRTDEGGSGVAATYNLSTKANRQPNV